MGPESAAYLVPLGVFTMVVLIVWFGTREKQARVQARTDLHKHLLDKFGSGSELAGFLETEGGKKMLEDLGAERVSPSQRALKHIQAGLVLLFLGIGFFLLMEFDRDLVVPGGILTALGLGFLVSGVVSRRLAASWKLERSEPGGPYGGTPAAGQQSEREEVV